MAIDLLEATLIGALLSELFMGVYITVFGLYIYLLRARKSSLVVVDYAVIILFILCFATIGMDAVQQFFTLMRGGAAWTAKVNATASTLSLTLDFISQIVLIYRCWHVWGCNLYIGILPSLLALSSYVTGLTVTIDLASLTDSRIPKDWWVPLGLSSMALSLVVNAVVSALMISRIYLVHKETNLTPENTGTKLSLSLIASILLESAIALFFAQLVYLILYTLRHQAFRIVVGPVTIIYGLNCTAIMVRVGMNGSFASVSTMQQQTTSFMFNVSKGENSTHVPEISDTDELSSKGSGDQRRGQDRPYGGA